MSKQLIDVTEVRKTLSILKPNNQIFEIRMMDADKNIMSGYFNDIDAAVKDLQRAISNGWQVYITLNQLNDSMTSRQQFGRIQKLGKKPATSKTDVIGYDWLFIDLDPDRSTGVSSTDSELQLAKELGNKIYLFMQQIGFEKPITAFSGNGVHLLYKIYLDNSTKNEKLISDSLDTLNMLFSTDKIKIDTANKDANRVCKLYGTLAQKGLDTADRPHRMSRMTSYPAEIKATPLAFLEKLVAQKPQLDAPRKYNNYSPTDFDLDSWLDKYMISYRTASYGGGTKYILDCCPFDSNHKGKDACIFRASNGAIGFKCLHNSCSDKTWKDVRMLYEPDAYEKKQMAQERAMYQNYNRNPVKPVVKQESKAIEKVANNPVFFTAEDILNIPRQNEVFVKTGIDMIDKKTRGLKRGFTSVWSGLRGSAKSTVLSEISLNAMDVGNRVGFFSGELAPKNFMRWMNQQAAGKAFVEPTNYEGYYTVPYEIQKKVAGWLQDKFWLYNNDYGNDSKAVIDVFEKQINEKKLDLLVLDNLMAFNLSTFNYDKYEAQKDFVWELHKLAQKTNTHIAFVAHPRKSMGFLRLDDISGSADIANAVEYAFIVHRNNNDFRRLSKQMFAWKDENKVYEGSNVIEICKDRDGGTQDYFIPLFYETETKRLKNHKTENVIYGWCNEDERFLNEFGETPFDAGLDEI